LTTGWFVPARERDLLAVGADLHLLAARPAGQQRVVLQLQAGPAGEDAMAWYR
jgi:hypothetical protein